MEFKSYVRNPFQVEALEITEDNLFEAAEFIGTIQEDEKGGKYILVDRRMVPNVTRVTPGFWMTKMGRNIRCFPGFIFKSQFIEITEDVREFLSNFDTTDQSPEGFPKEGEIVG